MANDWDLVIRKVNDIVKSDKAVRTAITTVLAEQKTRIFSDGFDSKGTQIGTYSTAKTSVSKKQQSRNTGKTYFKGGYAEYKTLSGNNPGHVILKNFGQMQSDYTFQVLGKDQYGLGYTNDLNYNKSQWMEKKYGKSIFNQSKNEGEILEKVINSELEKSLR